MPPQPIDHADRDTTFVASLQVWEEMFGQRPLSWVELNTFGVSLNPAEARVYLGEQLADPQRARLYQALFESHPELKAYVVEDADAQIAVLMAPDIARAEEQAPTAQFIARLAGQPAPEGELAALLERASRSPTGTAWFPTMAGQQWQPAQFPGESVGLFFHHLPAGIGGVIGRVRQRQTAVPNDPSLQAMYPEAHAYAAWWLLDRPRPLWFATLADIPGKSKDDKTADESFGKSRLSFAYWNFGLSLATVVERFGK